MHLPVLYHEVIDTLQPQSGGIYVDGTLGAGGHAWGILDVSSPDGRLLGLDLDPQALSIAKKRLEPFGNRVILVRASYVTIREQVALQGWQAVHGIVLDLGVSSMQLDTPERGFSFRRDAPLDMRFDPHNQTTAADLVNNLRATDLADLLYQYGEERRSRQVTRAIVAARPIYTTGELAEIVAKATGSGKKGIHPATRTFQALRIAVNHELDSIEQVLPEALSVLAPGGRLAVISFHSLEDRLVKRYFRKAGRDCLCPPKQPLCTCEHKAELRELSRKPLMASQAEAQKNPRARSARLRVAEKL